MQITFFSFLMAIFWFSAFVLVSSILRRKNGFILHYSVFPLLALVLTSVLRLVFSFELPFTKIIHSKTAIPFIMDFATRRLFYIREYEINFTMILLVIWGAGSLTLILYSLIITVRDYYRIFRYTVINDKRISKAVVQVLSESHTNLKYRLIVTPDATTAMMGGFFTPLFVIPHFVSDFTDDEIMLIIRHELLHFQHKDIWVKLILNLIQCAMWWNPFVYILKKDLSQILDLRCDLEVSQDLNTDGKTAYLNSMLKSLKHESGVAVPRRLSYLPSNLVTKSSGANMVQRFKMIIDYDQKKTKRSSKLFVLILVPLFILSMLIIVQPRIASPNENEDPVLFSSESSSYLILWDDGTYSLYIDDEYLGSFTHEDIQFPPLNTFQIMIQEENNQ